jgi:hypothetical protein
MKPNDRKKVNLTKNKRLTFALAFLMTATVGGFGLSATTLLRMLSRHRRVVLKIQSSIVDCILQSQLLKSVCPPETELEIIEINGECARGYYVPAETICDEVGEARAVEYPEISSCGIASPGLL